METFRRITKGETIEHMEMIYVSKDGRELYLEGNMSPSFKDGEFVSCRGIFRDITERKKAEEALRASEKELHDNYFTQSTINMILSESLKNIPLEEILQKSLNMVLSIPWLAFEPIGSIHLVEDRRMFGNESPVQSSRPPDRIMQTHSFWKMPLRTG